jgi:3-phosphoglycerate kinase
VLDDFRSTVVALPSNVGLAQAPEIAIGLGLEHDLVTLEKLVERCIRLGVASTNIRLCLAGSSRPDSLEIVETFLQRQLFDVCLVGPMADVLLLHAEGADLAPSLIEVVDRLARAGGTHLVDLRAGAARRIVENYPSRLLRPVDFVVRDARDPSRSRCVGRGELGQLNRHERIASIGPSTLEAYRERIEGASLVFHFGMMGSSDANDVAMTQDIIRAYADVGVESFMAGDHIVELANDLGLLGRNQSSLSAVTGADTTTFYMTGESLPGLAPFSNRGDRRR